MKIKTGLPYKEEDLSFIQNNGAIVEMNSINFPSIDVENQIETSLIYLRNTGFQVNYDFSKCSFERKSKFLIQYFTLQYELNIPELISTWLCILNYINNSKITTKISILSQNEIIKFIKLNQGLILNIFQVILSLPVYLALRLKQSPFQNDIKENDTFYLNNNIILLFQFQEFLYLYQNKLSLELKNFTKIFTMENNQLFTAINQKLPFGYLLYGLVQVPIQKFQ